jgi:hypothetical protein
VVAVVVLVIAKHQLQAVQAARVVSLIKTELRELRVKVQRVVMLGQQLNTQAVVAVERVQLALMHQAEITAAMAAQVHPIRIQAAQ